MNDSLETVFRRRLLLGAPLLFRRVADGRPMVCSLPEIAQFFAKGVLVGEYELPGSLDFGERILKGEPLTFVRVSDRAEVTFSIEEAARQLAELVDKGEIELSGEKGIG